MKAYKITNPLRFFGFFGLFLIFMFMAVKSCSDRRSSTEFVTADEIEKSMEDEQEKGNSAELEEFIEDVKEGIGQEEETPVAEKEVKVEKKKKPFKITKEKVVKKEVKKPKKREPKQPSTLNSLVKGSGNQINAFSKIQLKKDVQKMNSRGKGKVTVYGSYFPGEAKTKGFVRAAKIKNELIRFGLKNSMTVYILPESQSRTDRFGRIKFSK